MMRNEDTRALLMARLEALDRADTRGKSGTQTVTLDQQSVGRLSRMDALQSQAMAQAQERGRAIERQRLLAALERLEAGEYGYCVDCGEEIAAARLESDPAAPKCIGCARG
ncbi:TraR/DksA family transcriptional regulator [Celeribacter sp.]|uniref:TraR/DksA family transcriptional regulator n=1 Tax=Celeribacter sp. TaxID=1890673 RepID=UPI003A9190DE